LLEEAQRRLPGGREPRQAIRPRHQKPGAAGASASEAEARAVPDSPRPYRDAEPQVNLLCAEPCDKARKRSSVVIIASSIAGCWWRIRPGTVRDKPGFLRYAKSAIGQLNYSSAGIGALAGVTMGALLAPRRRKGGARRHRGAAPATDSSPGGAAQARHLRHFLATSPWAS
jgi:hypothetical protein